MIDLSEYEDMIRKLAWGCFKRLPANYYSLEGLEQEGRIVFTRLLTRRLRMDGAKFSTILYRSLTNRYNDIVRTALQPMRGHLRLINDSGVDNIQTSYLNPQEALELKEVIEYLNEIDPELADFFLNGPSDKLKKFAHSRVIKLRRRGNKEEKALSLDCIEEYFGLKFKDLAECFHIGRRRV